MCYKKIWLTLCIIICASLIINTDLNASENSDQIKEKLIQEIKDYRAKEGYAMDIKTLIDFLIKNPLSHSNLRNAFIAFRETQRPIFSKDDLKEIFEAKISSIATHYSEHTVQTISNDVNTFNEYIYAFDGRNVYIKKSEGKSLDDLELSSIRAFDGKVWRSLSMTAKGSPYGHVEENDYRQGIYIEKNILKLSMLQNPPKKELAHPSYSLVNNLEKEYYVVQEKLVQYDGRECILITDGVYDIYLDPQIGFSVVRIDSLILTEDVNGNVNGRRRNYERIYSDFNDFGNNLYLPQKIEEVYLERGEKKITSVSKMQINEDVPNKLFSDIFVDGTFIVDAIQNIAYVKGISDQIDFNSLVKNPLPEFKEFGIEILSEDINNKMILVCFFDIEQRPSRNCIIQLNKRDQELKEKDIVVIAVHASKIEQAQLDEWIKENEIIFPVGMTGSEEEKTRFNWGVKSLPWLILTDKNHVVTAEGFSINELTKNISILSSTNTKVEIKKEDESDVKYDVPTFDEFISAITTAERSLMNVKIEGELFQEERQSLTDPWEHNSVYVNSIAWYSGKPKGKVRVDVHREVLEWIEGAAPYAEEHYSLGFDGQTGRRVIHRTGAKDDTIPAREAEILPDAPLDLRSPWRDISTGAAFSLYFLLNDEAMTTSEMLKIYKEADDSFNISRETYQGADCIKISMFSGKRFYWFDLERGYAFRGYQDMKTDKEGHKVINSSIVVPKVVEAAPGIWFPTEATYLAAVGFNGRPGLRNIFKASKVIANDPSFDENIYTVPIPPNYVVEDRISGVRYRSTGKEGNN